MPASAGPLLQNLFKLYIESTPNLFLINFCHREEWGGGEGGGRGIRLEL